MKISLIFFIYLSFIVSARKRKTPAANSDEVFEFLPFALDFRGSVRKKFALEAAMLESSKSSICSPVSVLLPLGNLVLGAEGTTKEQLLSAIGITTSKQLDRLFTHLIVNMEHLEGVTLDVVSRIYISSENKINDNFARLTTRIFNSTGKKFDPSDPSRAAKLINQWVSKNTRQKINHLVSASDIKADTSLILVNAIYFAGNWKDKFVKTLTKDFYSTSGVRAMTMMTREGIYKYWLSKELDAQVIEIPYQGSRVSLIIVLPNTIRGLKSLLRSLKHSPEELNSALGKMKATDIKLTIPRFRVETTLDLNSMYKKMGVKKIFTPNSELTGIINGETVYVTKGIHKAFIEVNEEGTEASAATAVFGGKVSGTLVTGQIEFAAINPFYFVIKMYQEQLFAGIFTG